MIKIEEINIKFKPKDIQIISKDMNERCFIGSPGFKSLNYIKLIGSFSKTNISFIKSIINKRFYLK